MNSADDYDGVDAVTTVTGPEYSFKMDGVKLEEDSVGVLTLQTFREITLDLLEFGRVTGTLYVSLMDIMHEEEKVRCLDHGGKGITVTCLRRSYADVCYFAHKCDHVDELDERWEAGLKIVGNDLTSLPLLFLRNGPRISNHYLLEIRTPFFGEIGQGFCIYVECRFV